MGMQQLFEKKFKHKSIPKTYSQQLNKIAPGIAGHFCETAL